MSRILTILLVSGAFLLTFCGKSGGGSGNETMPANAKPIDVMISQVNCWVEGENFYVTGICNSQSNEWQKIWLRMQPLDGKKNPTTLDGEAEVVFPVFSAAMPPRGRSAFFQNWPVKNFAGYPDTCLLSCAGAITKEAGAILVVEGMSSVRIFDGGEAKTERGWQIDAFISNPLEKTATRPCLELLLYGKDNRLWFANLMNPEDPAFAGTLQLDSIAPIAPQSKRHFTTKITYGNLPEYLRTEKIGQVEILPFENR